MRATRALLAALWLLAPAVADAAESYAFDGVFVPADSGSYSLLEFEVPEGTARVHVTYSYQASAPQDDLFSNTLDLGIYDDLLPDAYRGWSGSNKSSATVALAVEDTTDSYVPGPMPARTWAVELGVGLVAAGTTTSWDVTVQTEDGSGPAWQPPEWQPVTLAGPGWYAGDLHCHSPHSDGGYPVEEVFAQAHAAGLDFNALTDHNAFTGHYEMPAVQGGYDDLALIRGMEMTSYRGHANFYGATGYFDYHASRPGYDVNALFDAVHAAGGYVSINHPDHFGVEPAPGITISLGWTVEDTDWSRVDFIEVLNGASTLSGVLSNPLNEAALERWDELLAAGHRIVAIGGSDDHKAAHGSTDDSFYYAPLGTPTTVVYAEELSEMGILEGLKRGQVFLRADGPTGPDLYLTALCGGPEVPMGGEGSGSLCRVVGQALRGAGASLRFIVDGAILEEVEVGSDDLSHHVDVEPADLSIARLELRRDGFVQALTNPVFLRHGPGGFVPDEAADEAGCACALRGARTTPWSHAFAGLLALFAIATLSRRRARPNRRRADSAAVPGTARLVAAVMAVCATSSSSCAPQPSPSEPIAATAAPRGAQGAARAQGEPRAAGTAQPAPGSTQPSAAADGSGADRDASAGPASSAGSGFRFAPGCPGAERHELAKRKVEQIAKRLTCASLHISRFPDAAALDVRSDSWEIYPQTPWGERAPFAEYCRFDRRMLQRVDKAVWAGLDETDRACMLGYSVRVVGGDREQVRQLNDRVRSRCGNDAMLTWLVVDFDAGGKAQAVRPRSGVHVDGDSPERRCLRQALRGKAYPCLANSTLCQGNVVE